jgi:hypothetical protein
VFPAEEGVSQEPGEQESGHATYGQQKPLHNG